MGPVKKAPWGGPTPQTTIPTFRSHTVVCNNNPKLNLFPTHVSWINLIQLGQINLKIQFRINSEKIKPSPFWECQKYNFVDIFHQNLKSNSKPICWMFWSTIGQDCHQKRRIITGTSDWLELLFLWLQQMLL